MGKGYSEDRREFLRGLGRVALLGGLIVGAGSLIRREETARRIETCASDGICRNCRNLRDCGLPQALSYRRAKS